MADVVANQIESDFSYSGFRIERELTSPESENEEEKKVIN